MAGVVGDQGVGGVGRESHSSLSSGHQHNNTTVTIVHLHYDIMLVTTAQCIGGGKGEWLLLLTPPPPRLPTTSALPDLICPSRRMLTILPIR